MKRALLTVLFGATFHTTVSAADLELRTGNFRIVSSMAMVTVAVTNGSERSYTAVRVDCGFLGEDGIPVGSGTAFIENLVAGASGYDDAGAFNAKEATRADCRIVEAR